MSEEREAKESVRDIFARLIAENPNLPQIKQTIKTFIDTAELLTYHGITGNEEHYLQVYGLSYHEEEHFNYLNQLLHSRTTEFLDRIAENKVEVRSTIPPPPPPPPEVPSEIVQEVEQVLNNLDLPISLFKRNDNYWSHDNPKTQQVKDYIKLLHEQDRRWKGELKKKRQSILNEKNQIYHKNNKEQQKQTLKQKQQDKNKMIKKIQFFRSQSESRKKTIEESLEFMKKQGRPLFKKMEEQFHSKVQIPSLEERKRKLSQVRNLRKSVDLVQIQQHKQKLQKIKDQHQNVKIYNEPVKVSFKGSFHQSLEKSRIDQLTGDSRFRTLCDKRYQYSRVVKEQYKPTVDQNKASEIAERIQLMNKRFTRAKRDRKRDVDEDEDDEEEEEEEPEPEPEEEDEPEEEEDQDEEDGEPKRKDDQYEPSQQDRYKMGLKYLEEARRLRKKVESAPRPQLPLSDSPTKTFSMSQIPGSQLTSLDNQPPGSIESSRKIKYRNYLHEMSKTNKTIDHIDTSRVKNQFTLDMKLKQPAKAEQIEYKLRNIQQKAKFQEQLLKYDRRKKGESLQKKQQLDNVILDTIKARLALMKN